MAGAKKNREVAVIAPSPSPEKTGKTLPLIYTDDTNQEKIG
jgi:hypothetical protein